MGSRCRLQIGSQRLSRKIFTALGLTWPALTQRRWVRVCVGHKELYAVLCLVLDVRICRP